MRKIAFLFLTTLLVVTASAQEVSFRFTDGIYNAGLKARMERNVSALLTEINAAAGEERNLNLSGITTSEAATSLRNLWKNFGFVCQSNPQSICYGLTSGYQARKIQISVTRQPEDCNDPKDRELVVSFDKTGNITRVAIALQHKSMLVANNGADVSDVKRRNEILKFVEDFRNYYIEHDIASLRKIYSDDALIITGKTIDTRTEGDYAARYKNKTTYTVQTKEEYLNNLEKLFRYSKHTDVQFEDIMISPANSESMQNYYGVNLKQHFTNFKKDGSTYQDTGYLFLLWDFREDPPVIHIRAWQNEETHDDEIITIDDCR